MRLSGYRGAVDRGALYVVTWTHLTPAQWGTDTALICKGPRFVPPALMHTEQSVKVPDIYPYHLDIFFNKEVLYTCCIMTISVSNFSYNAHLLMCRFDINVYFGFRLLPFHKTGQRHRRSMACFGI